ncbi:MAG: succinylglutamate desuccinylase/aspartoacylase family protein [Bdellovibrionales bacterium]|nr:succinylglutamate desuccinylase/aspartoacylase family protein [Bdellovibrionales bacterium]
MFNKLGPTVILITGVAIGYGFNHFISVVDTPADQTEKKVVEKPQPKPQKPKKSPEEILMADTQKYCNENLNKIPGQFAADHLKSICEKVKILPNCTSVEGDPIFHMEKEGVSKRGKRILALSLIHGDEFPSGTVALKWMSRLLDIDSRNTWRVIPIANPDGWKKGTRMNINGLDLNRNFPTNDWDDMALDRWKNQKKSDPRRYPGPGGGSEPETKCLISHIQQFKPDFIISVHTPYGILDFDGPEIDAPHFYPLQWRRFGNFPGSLGRYMWKDRQVPVLTIELKGNDAITKLEELDKLQDITGLVAIRADEKLSDSEKKSNN